MITISVPYQAVADALGDLGADVRVIVWDPSKDDAPAHEREQLTMVCIAHSSGGRRIFGRIADCPQVRVIQIPSAGYEHALPFVPSGVALANARGLHDSRVAEYAILLALASLRDMPTVIRNQDKQVWSPDYDLPNLADRRALVVGYGSIGAAIGARLRAMEVEVEGVATTARVADDGTRVHAFVDLPRLLPSTEVVFLVTPHNDQTDKMVNAEFLAALPDGALLVNVGRGKCVDQEALLAELQGGRLRAALDVTDPEPLPADHPLWRAPGTIIAPHVAGVTSLTDRRYTDIVKRQVEALRAGNDPVNLVMRGVVTE
jgi:phosphoglycerate dehydrogenase-like enzyme